MADEVARLAQEANDGVQPRPAGMQRDLDVVQVRVSWDWLMLMAVLIAGVGLVCHGW